MIEGVIVNHNWKNTAKNIGLFCTLAITYFFSTCTSVKAAEKVVLRYGLLQESISVAELQNIAATGKIPSEYKIYTNRFSAQQRQQFVQVLRAQRKINFVTLSRFLYTPVGVKILKDFSQVIYRKDNAGVQALRAGLVAGAANSEGLSLISFIQAYPSQSLEINIEKIPKVFRNLNLSFQQTQNFIQAINPQIAAKPNQLKFPFDPSQTGSGKVQIIKLSKLEDKQRQRLVPVDIYWSNSTTADKPVVIFSHGFSSDNQDMRYIAEHLASHGYVVAAVEHIGSNQNYQLDPSRPGVIPFMNPQEFLERPQDISFILDKLAELNQSNESPLKGKLATDKAMVIGHSFGGGTALSIAGAELQVDFLKTRCPQILRITVNIGQGLQCVGERLPENRYQLRDNRIKQAIALNPTTSLMFGQTGLKKLQVPTLMLASSADITTPALTEQVIGFSKIPAAKWLVGIIGATHSSIKDPISTAQREEKGNTEIVGKRVVSIRKYMKAITLAFASQMTSDADKYQMFLTPEYAEFASTPEFAIRLVTKLPPEIIETINNIFSEN